MSPTPNYGWRKQSKCIFDSDRRVEFRRIRDIWVRDSENRLYMYYKGAVNHYFTANVCIYKSKIYQQGQKWQDGCEYNCTCEDATTGFYRCKDLWVNRQLKYCAFHIQLSHFLVNNFFLIPCNFELEFMFHSFNGVRGILVESGKRQNVGI